MKKTEINYIIDNFTYNVTYLRKANNLSKKRMAEILGISVYILNKIEKGILPHSVNVDMLFKIQDFFNILAGNLFEKKINN